MPVNLHHPHQHTSDALPAIDPFMHIILDIPVESHLSAMKHGLSLIELT